jgi:hypothetical protein
MSHHSDFGQIVIGALLAAFGGAVKYVAAVLRSANTVTQRRFVALLLANVFISSFCGLMGMFLVKTATDSLAWLGLASGMFGYLGTTGLDIVILSLRKKIDPQASVSTLIPLPPEAEKTRA